MIRFADLGPQNRRAWSHLEERLRSLVSNSNFIGGANIEEFEREFARYTGARRCVGVANGTDALELILASAGVSQGDEVLLPAFSFAATLEAVLNVGASPKFVDIDESQLISPSSLARNISERTRAVIVVHLHGKPFDVQGFLSETMDNGVLVIEDAAQAHGAAINGGKAGALGHASAFSFYPGKNLGAWGDGGAVITNDELLADEVRRLSNHGRLNKFDHQVLGRNSRLDSIQAAVLTVKLGMLDEINDRRRSIAGIYQAGLSDLETVLLPKEDPGLTHAWHHYSILVPRREDFRAALHHQGVETGIHYPYALPDLPYVEEFWEVPMSRRAANENVSLPLGEHLSDSDAYRVVDTVRATIQRGW